MVKNSPCGHHRTTLSGCIFVAKAHIDSRKKLVKQQYLLSPPHILTRWRMFGTTGFASWLRYCSNVTHWRPTKLCMMFDHLLHYNIYTFLGALAPNGILPGASKCCVLPYWQHYCTALEQWASAKLCGVEQRAPPIFGRAAMTLGIGPYSS